jgi:hypothetical protein
LTIDKGNNIKKLIRKILSPSMRFGIRDKKDWLKERLNLAAFWRWKQTYLYPKEGSQFKVRYWGRQENINLAETLLGIDRASGVVQADHHVPERSVTVSEIPIPGAIRVPKYLRAIVPLEGGMEAIIADYDSELRRRLKKYRPNFHTKQALTDEEIDAADNTLLRPFASDRHGAAVNHMPSKTVRDFAQRFGRLDLVYENSELVACLLAMEYWVAGKKYWILDRFGYPESVFSDPKRLGHINAMNNHIAMEWAIENGYDYYDIGLVFARPWDGLLHWKKRRGSIMRTTALPLFSHFYLKVSDADAAEFFWESPLFSEDGRGLLTLHLGLPAGKSDADFLDHYNKMTFRELRQVNLYTTTPPSEALLNSLGDFYRRDVTPPKIKPIITG